MVGAAGEKRMNRDRDQEIAGIKAQIALLEEL